MPRSASAACVVCGGANNQLAEVRHAVVRYDAKHRQRSLDVMRWRQAKMRPTFARAREPSRIVDGDLEAMQIVDAEIQVRTWLGAGGSEIRTLGPPSEGRFGT